MTLLIVEASPSPWLLPALLVLVLAVQVGGFLAAEKLVKTLGRRRRRGPGRGGR